MPGRELRIDPVERAGERLVGSGPLRNRSLAVHERAHARVGEPVPGRDEVEVRGGTAPQEVVGAAARRREERVGPGGRRDGRDQQHLAVARIEQVDGLADDVPHRRDDGQGVRQR